MASNNTQGLWHELISGWSLRPRIITVFAINFILLSISAVVIFVSVLIIFQQHGNGELGPFKVAQPKTPLEKNCRLLTEKARVQDQDISNEILALEAQVATKDQELSKTREKCLDAQAKDDHNKDLINLPKSQSRCRTEISSTDSFGAHFAHPQGDYETALTSAAEDRNDIRSKIAAKEHLRMQQQQKLEQVCLGVVAQDVGLDVGAKDFHTP